VRSTEDLLAAAIRFADSGDHGDDFSQTVALLHERGGRDVLSAAFSLCREPASARRKLGALILGQLGSRGRAFTDESAEDLLRLVRGDPDVEVVKDAVFALGHLSHKIRVDALASLAGSPDDETRHAVAFALANIQAAEGVETLLRLMNDPCLEARDWATTGVAGMVSQDGAHIRDALLARCADTDAIVRAEALNGLALRADRRAIPILIHEIEAGTEPAYRLEEAAKLILASTSDESTDVSAPNVRRLRKLLDQRG